MTLTSRVRQGPCQRCSLINPLRVKVSGRKELPGFPWVDCRVAGIDDSLPAILDMVNAAVAKERIPLLLHKRRSSHERGRREDGNHVDALNTFNIWREEGCMVDLVLKQDPCHFVADELRRLYLVLVLVEIIELETP